MTKPRIVAIDDEVEFIDMLTKYFLPRGYDFNAAIRGAKGIELVKEKKPDVVQCDLKMPGLDGDEVLKLLNAMQPAPKLIFVTAYDEYAIRAFEVNALDYILKPLKKERIAKAMERLLKGNCNDAPRQQYGIEDTIFLSTGLKACFLKLKDIHYIEADSCYSRVIVSENISKCSVQTLKKWSDILPVHEFVRIHRSYIVNVGHIARIEKRANGTYSVFLHHIDRPIEISRRCASDLRSKLSL